MTTTHDQLKQRLSVYYTDEEIGCWMTSAHPQLQGERPIDLVGRGDADQVFAIIDRLDGDGYL